MVYVWLVAVTFTLAVTFGCCSYGYVWLVTFGWFTFVCLRSLVVRLVTLQVWLRLRVFGSDLRCVHAPCVAPLPSLITPVDYLTQLIAQFTLPQLLRSWPSSDPSWLVVAVTQLLSPSSAPPCLVTHPVPLYPAVAPLRAFPFGSTFGSVVTPVAPDPVPVALVAQFPVTLPITRVPVRALYPVARTHVAHVARVAGLPF